MHHKSSINGKGVTLVVSVLLSMALALSAAEAATPYVQTNLVSDITGLAKFTDPDLVNPWGISHSPTSPFWVSNNGTGLATLYNPAIPGPGIKLGLVVTIPPAGAGTPTGQVFNSNSAAGAFNRDLFLFASEDGTISGWRGALGTTAETLQVADPANVYKGLALGAIGTHAYLYAANFRNGTIDVLKGDAGAPSLTGSFVDPTLPSGFAPFNIQTLGNELYVTYAKQDATGHDDVPGAGNGFVDMFDLNGNLLTRLISNGVLNSPWGLALAPADFGQFSNDLLVGNFGDGTINAFDPVNGNLLGTLSDSNGQPIAIDGLWGLIFGNGGNGGKTNILYFTAGPDDETHGLFGSLAPVPLPGTFLLLGSGLLGILAAIRKR